MTFPLRRKRRTTARGRSITRRIASSVLSLSLITGSVLAQDSPTLPSAAPSSSGTTQIITDEGPVLESNGGGFLGRIKGLFHRDQTVTQSTVVVMPSGSARTGTTPDVLQLPAVTSPMPIATTTAAPPVMDMPASAQAPIIKHVSVMVQPTDASGASAPLPVASRAPEPLPTVPSEIITTAAQQAPATPRQPPQTGQQRSPGYLEEDTTETSPEVSVIPPGMGRVMERASEAAVLETIRQKALERVPPERVDFPDEPILPTDQPVARPFPPGTLQVEPHYLQYRRLLFEDINSERYGWDLGFIQPVVSTGKFLADFVAMPYHLGTQPLRCYESDAGYCLPGDPVPYILYPPTLSVTGAIYEAGAVLAIYAIFPG